MVFPGHFCRAFQKSTLYPEVINHQNDLFHHLCSLGEQSLSAQLQSTISKCVLHLAVECCMERAASSWLSALPFEQYGFSLHKGEFCLCYDFTPSMLPSHCVCVFVCVCVCLCVCVCVFV